VRASPPQKKRNDQRNKSLSFLLPVLFVSSHSMHTRRHKPPVTSSDRTPSSVNHMILAICCTRHTRFFLGTSRIPLAWPLRALGRIYFLKIICGSNKDGVRHSQRAFYSFDLYRESLVKIKGKVFLSVPPEIRKAKTFPLISGGFALYKT
jgi:hypothetical protein